MSDPSLRFLGATDTVTGSRYLVESGGVRVLVDCGLFQGYKVFRERNRRPFPVAPETIDAVVLSHAHLDHSGYLPALVRDGFAGHVWASPGTIELCRIMLADSAYLMEEEARHAASRHWSRHADPRPIYTSDDVRAMLPHFRELGFDEHRTVAPGVEARLVHAGHILGAAQVRIGLDDGVVHFTGDLGRAVRPAHARARPARGLRSPRHGVDLRRPGALGRGSPADRLGEVIRPHHAQRRRGAHPGVRGRTHRDRAAAPVATARPRPAARRADLPQQPDGGRRRRDLRALPRGAPARVRRARADVPARHADHDRRRLQDAEPARRAHGRHLRERHADGGRILHHLREYGPDPRNAIVLTGFQAGGTRGAALAAGERSLRIFGEDVPIRAEVVAVDSMSAHPDADEVLDWLHAAPGPRRTTYVTHGEPHAADALRARIKHELGWDVRVPDQSERVPVESRELSTTEPSRTRRTP